MRKIFPLLLLAGAANAVEWQTETRVLHSLADGVDAVKPHLWKMEVESVERDGVNVWAVKSGVTDYPGISFKLDPPQDWSGHGGLAIDIRNTGLETLRIAYRVDDNPAADGHRHCRGGDVTILPGEGGTYVMPFGPAPQSLGMKVLPGPQLLPGANVMASGGWADFSYAHIVNYCVYLVRPSQEHTFTLSNIRLVPGQEVNYENLLDAFGQYTRQEWPGKMKSADDLVAQRDAEAAQLAANPALPGRDKFGGWADGPQLEATGFFRTAKFNGKWSLVDPEGRLFLSVGPCSVGVNNTTVYTGREQMFSVKPADDPVLAKHLYKKAPWESFEGDAIDFFRANLERKYGADWSARFKDVTLARLPAWGCNTIAGFSGWEWNANGRVPYVFTLWVWGRHKTLGRLPDPFDPQYAIDVRDTLNSIPENVRRDPWLIGYFVNNEEWYGHATGRERHMIPLNALNRGAADSPAKNRLVEMLKEKHGDIGKLNAAWQTNFETWDALSAPYTPPNPLPEALAADLSAFLDLWVRTYYGIVRAGINAASPNHLYLGCRYVGTLPPEVLAAGVDLHDVLSFNIYQTIPSLPIAEGLDKPIVIGEFHFGATDTGLPPAALLNVADQASRAANYITYLRALWDNPNFVGAHWFQYYDQPLTGRPMDGENGNIGFVSITDTPYPELLEAVKTAHAEMYDYRFK